MSLRRLLVASSLIVTPVATLSLAPAAFADTDSNSIGVSGTVPSIIAITATQTAAATALPLSTGGDQTAKIADVSITSNNTAGITITATSTNNGILQSSTNVSDTVEYQIAIVNDGSATPTSYTNLSSLSQSETSGFSQTTGVKELDLYIKVANPTLPKRGNYIDTITLTVADN